MAFKGMNKDMKCQNFQFKVGEKYKHDGQIKLCTSGFHACENPFDVWDYYPIARNNRFFEVSQSGENKSDERKTVSEKIEVKAEIGLKGLNNASVKFLFSKCKASSGDYVQQASSGDNAQQASSGDNVQQASSGYNVQQASSGDNAKGEVSGKNSIACHIGVQSKTKACKDSWIVLVDWQYKNKWIVKNIHHAKVGQKIKGTVIQPDVWYWFEDGLLKATK